MRLGSVAEVVKREGKHKWYENKKGHRIGEMESKREKEERSKKETGRPEELTERREKRRWRFWREMKMDEENGRKEEADIGIQ
jgi:hypothetical protein